MWIKLIPSITQPVSHIHSLVLYYLPMPFLYNLVFQKIVCNHEVQKAKFNGITTWGFF